MLGVVLTLALMALQAGLMTLWPFRPQLPWFLGGLAVFYLLAAAAWLLLRRGRLTLPWLLVTALLLRALWIPASPGLSEDVYRYLWDGALTAHGENPYLRAPQERLDFQSRYPDLYQRMAHTDRTSIYPPVAQFLFLLNHLLWGPSVIGWKCLLLLFEAMMAALWWKAGFRRAQDWALWLLNPLVLLEFYSSGHLDLVTAAMWVGAILWLPAAAPDRGGWRAALSPLLLGMASLTKLMPLMTAPFFWLRMKGWRASIRSLLWLAGGFALPAGLYFAWQGDLAESWGAFLEVSRTYHQKWRFNSPFFLIYEARRPEVLAMAGRIFALAWAVLLAYAFFLARRGDGSRAGTVQTASALYFLLMFFYACSYTVHPWYTTWAIALYPLIGLRYWAGLWLGAASFLSYSGYWFAYPQVEERAWVLWLEYFPFYTLLVFDLWKWVKSRPRPSTVPSASR
ncbi:MAG TPA: glycosyltransferase 87 family protein [Acidobacteriota bacterium]|nr:glycosyltransferase 87 family protein [Acidobacteriota bacterium]